MKTTQAKAAPAANQSVPYFDLKRQYTSLKTEMEAAMLETLSSGQYVLGGTVENFEKAFAQYCGTSSAVGVGSGTDALIFALRALGIGKGDEVIAPSFTFSASIFSILHVGATPVLAEVDPKTYTLDPESVEKSLTSRARAIMPVHLFGQMADMDALGKIARKRKLKIVEDACQAHGAEFKGKKSGFMGDAGCFSFYPTKNLGGAGDGGIVTTNGAKIAESVMKQRNLGRVSLSDPHQMAGWTSRLDALQAAFLNIKLKSLDTFNDNRRKAAAIYKRALAGTPLGLPVESEGRKHVYHLFVVRVPDGKRDALQAKLAADGIRTMVHYATPVHKQPACRDLVKKTSLLTVTDKISREILSLPMFPEMTEDEVLRVAQCINSFYKG